MSFKQIGPRFLAVVLCFLVSNAPQHLAAQNAPAAPQSSQSEQQKSQAKEPNAQQSQTAANPQAGGTRYDPAQAPLAPVPSARPSETSTVPPDAPSEVQRSQQAQSTENTAQPKPQPAQPERINPLGTATAQEGATRGGVASRPAGEAIAPAKQKQVHSLLIKLGLVAAGAAAVGTVVGLTRGTSSTPPGAR
jgi:hypothetical protein